MTKVAEFIKKEAKVEKLTNKEKLDLTVGDISLEKIKEFAKSREMPGKDENAKIRQIIGACVSYKVTIDGKDPRELKNYPN